MAKNKAPEKHLNQTKNKQEAGTIFGILLNKPILVLSILVFVTYMRTLGFEYIALDDDKIILQNIETITQPSAIWKSFVSPYGFMMFNTIGNDDNNISGSPYYRPVVNLSFVINALAGGKSPLIYHLTNLLVHLISVCFVFLVLLKLFNNKPASFLLAVIFAVHPVMTNAVAWIAGRNDLLAGMFSILAFYYLLVYLDNKKLVHVALHTVFLTLAVFSKELAVFIPFLFLGFVVLSGKMKDVLQKHRLLIAVWILPLIIFTVARGAIIQKVNVEYGLQPFLHNIRALPELLVKSIIPFSYSPLPIFSDLATLAGSLLVIALVILPFFNRSIERKNYYFGLAWFVILIAPGLFILYPDQAEKFDYLNCRTYLPSMGLLILFGASIPVTVWQKISLKPIVPMLFIAVAFGVTQYNLGYYKNPEVFAGALQLFNPDSPFTYRKSADLYFAQGNFPRAVEYMDKALQTAPESIALRKNIALAYAQMGDLQNALKHLTIGLAKNPKDLEFLSGLIKVQFMMGDYEQCYNTIEKLQLTGKNISSLYPLYAQLADKMQSSQPEKSAALRALLH